MGAHGDSAGHLCKAGYLSQQHRADGRWRSRLWFVCDDGTKLAYFTHRPSGSEIPNCILRFLDASDAVSDVVTQAPDGGYTFELRIDGGADAYTLKADTSSEAQEVQAHLQHPHSRKTLLNACSHPFPALLLRAVGSLPVGEYPSSAPGAIDSATWSQHFAG